MADKFIQIVYSNPLQGRDDEFNEWYDAEHLPQLGRVPGVLCARRYRGSGERKYLALYHLARADVARSDAWHAAADTPWTERMRPNFRNLLVLRCRRYRREGQ